MAPLPYALAPSTWPHSPLLAHRRCVRASGPATSQGEGPAENGPDPRASSAPEDLAQKLAAVEAEAEVLRRELAMRKAAEVGPGLGAKRGGKWAKKIDGLGYRETIFAGPTTAGKLAKEEGATQSWGFSEAELLQTEGGLAKLQEEYGMDSDDKPISKEEAQQIVRRRLLIGSGLSVAALAVAFVDIPVTVAPPLKPLSVYLVPLLRLQAELKTVQDQAEYLDALGLRSQLKLATGSMSSVRDNILSVTALLDSSVQPAARSLAFDVLGYLEQADYSKYFEGVGVPAPYQQTEYIKFSLRSLEVAQEKLGKFFALVPNAPLETAKAQLDGAGILATSSQ